MKALYLITYAQNYYEGGDKKVTCENYLFDNKEEAMQRFFLFIDENVLRMITQPHIAVMMV